MTPVEILWLSDGSPDVMPGTLTVGVCALAGTTGPVWPISDVVSSNWSDWSELRWLNQTDPVIGSAAVWAFRRWGPVRGDLSAWKDGTLTAIAIRPDGRVDRVRRGDPIPTSADAAVVVPMSRQRHVVPYARWGHWSTEGHTVHVTPRLVAAVEVLAGLRRLGLGEAEAREPHPRSGAHTRLGLTLPDLWGRWAAVRVLQEHPAMIAMAVRLTRQPKET